MAAAKRNQKKQSAKNGKRLPILLVLVLIIGIVTYFRDDIPFIKSVPTDGSVSVYFLDVGQGDSELIVTDTAAVLIDGGERTEGDTLLADFQQYGISKLDYVIASHPHTDHIGGLTVFLGMDPADSGVTVGTVITADVPDADIPTTKTYEQFLDNAEAHAEDVCFLSESMELDLGSATLQLIPSPIKSDAETLNEYSICGLLTSGANTFFFTGDAGKQEEQALLAENLLPSQPVDVLKVGHHGSKGSSSTEFLQALHPTDAVISCAPVDAAFSGNSYGHPHQGALERLQEVGCTIYRTDLDGTICIRSDGKALTIQTEAEAS